MPTISPLFCNRPRFDRSEGFRFAPLFDSEAGWWLAPLMALPHRDVGGFEAPGKAGGVKEGIGVAVVRELGSNGSMKRPIAGELERQRRIVLKRGGNEFAKAGRIEQ